VKASGTKRHSKTTAPVAPESARRLKTACPAEPRKDAKKPAEAEQKEWTEADRDSEFLHNCADEIDTRTGDVRAALLHIQSLIVREETFHGAFDDVRKALETLTERASIIRERAAYRAAERRDAT
jgi:hypothetical protein